MKTSPTDIIMTIIAWLIVAIIVTGLSSCVAGNIAAFIHAVKTSETSK